LEKDQGKQGKKTRNQWLRTVVANTIGRIFPSQPVYRKILLGVAYLDEAGVSSISWLGSLLQWHSSPSNPRRLQIVAASKSLPSQNPRCLQILDASKPILALNPRRLQVLAADKSSPPTNPRRRQILDDPLWGCSLLSQQCAACLSVS